MYLISVIPTVLLNIKIFKKWFSLFEERCEKLRFVEVLKTILIKNENLQEIKTYNVTKFLKEKINNIYSTNARENKNVRENFMWKTSLTKLLEQCIAYYVKLTIILFSTLFFPTILIFPPVIYRIICYMFKSIFFIKILCI